MEDIKLVQGSVWQEKAAMEEEEEEEGSEDEEESGEEKDEEEMKCSLPKVQNKFSLLADDE